MMDGSGCVPPARASAFQFAKPLQSERCSTRSALDRQTQHLKLPYLYRSRRQRRRLLRAWHVAVRRKTEPLLMHTNTLKSPQVTSGHPKHAPNKNVKNLRHSATCLWAPRPRQSPQMPNDEVERHALLAGHL